MIDSDAVPTVLHPRILIEMHYIVTLDKIFKNHITTSYDVGLLLFDRFGKENAEERGIMTSLAFVEFYEKPSVSRRVSKVQLSQPDKHRRLLVEFYVRPKIPRSAAFSLPG